MAHRFLANLCNPWSSSCFIFRLFTSPHGATSHETWISVDKHKHTACRWLSV